MSSLQFSVGLTKDETKKNAADVIETYYAEIKAMGEKVLAVVPECFDSIKNNRGNHRVSQKDLIYAIRFTGKFWDLNDDTIAAILKDAGYQGIGDRSFHGKGGTGILRPGEAKPEKGAAAAPAAGSDNGKTGPAAAAPKGGQPRSARA